MLAATNANPAGIRKYFGGMATCRYPRFDVTDRSKIQLDSHYEYSNLKAPPIVSTSTVVRDSTFIARAPPTQTTINRTARHLRLIALHKGAPEVFNVLGRLLHEYARIRHFVLIAYDHSV
jgi:hypothetical protein